MKYLKITILIFSLVTIKFNAFSQVKGSVVIKGENIYLDSLIDKNIEINKQKKTIEGFRIQLFSGNERNNANNIKTKFLRLYREQKAYITYQQPYFKIRVGDFRTKLEAKIFYNKIKVEFEECIIISDKINLPKL
jgi:hypothetical protein